MDQVPLGSGSAVAGLTARVAAASAAQAQPRAAASGVAACSSIASGQADLCRPLKK